MILQITNAPTDDRFRLSFWKQAPSNWSNVRHPRARLDAETSPALCEPCAASRCESTRSALVVTAPTPRIDWRTPKMTKRFRSNPHNAQRLTFYFAFVALGATACGSDATGSKSGGVGGQQQAAGASGAAVGGQPSGGASAGSAGAPAAGTAGAEPAAGGAGAGGAAPSGGSGGALGHGGGASGGAAGGGNAGTGTGGGGAADCSSFLLCDDFEGAAPGATTSPWKVTMGNSYTVEVVSTPVHGGTHAAHMSAPTGTGGGYLTATKGFPATDFWGRAWVRVKSPAGGHQCLIALNAAANEQVRVLNEMGSGEVASNLKSTDKLNDASGTKVPQDTWFCYEWHQSPTALHVYVDSTEVTAAAATWSVATINSLQVGIQRFQAGAAKADYYYDDVAVNTTRIGCN